MGLNGIDWLVIIVYSAGMLLLSAWLSLRQKSQQDYFLGGNDTGPLAIALSTLATQCSTNSLLGAPAFVAFVAGGGLVWLQYELALPVSMIVLMAVLMPILRRLQLISIYSYLEKRFSLTTRLVLSGAFLLIRAFATGVTIYGVGLVLSLIMGIPYWLAVILLGFVTVCYDMMGGMKAVIVSDVIQVIVLLGSILAATAMAIHLNGGWHATLDGIVPVRFQAIDFSDWGLDFLGSAGARTDYGFWPMFIGGFFLYLAYYGCDQTQAQRSLSTRSPDDTNQALFLGGLLRFPLVLTYCLLGVAIGAYAQLHPGFIGSLVDANGATRVDLAVPRFVIDTFPHGLIGLVMVGLFSAAMSSLDSTINSMSAVTMHDYVIRFRKTEMPQKTELWLSKFVTFTWGTLAVIFSFYVDNIAETVLVAVNKVGSIINGPILAVFLMGMLSRRINAAGAISGLVAGITGNLLLWAFCPGVSWLWWNVFGFGIAWAVGYGVSLLGAPPAPEQLQSTLATSASKANDQPLKKNWMPYYAILALYSVCIFFFLWSL